MQTDRLIETINDCAYRIRKKLSAGYMESVYKNAMVIELRRHGLSFETEKPIEVTYDGFIVGKFCADIIVENQIILELKAVSSLTTAHSVQLVNYLTATGIDDGLLINFGGEKLEIKRKYRVYTKQS